MKYNKHQYIEQFKSQLTNYSRDWDTDEYTNMWVLYSNGYVMVENPYRQEPYYDFYYVHHSVVESYPYRVYTLKELDEIY